MAEFWKSRKIKANKEYKCIYCDKKINRNELYYRESGRADDRFQDYCLCLRCKWLIEELNPDDEYLGNLDNALMELDLLSCPHCGAYGASEREYSRSGTKIECECSNCGKTWGQDISIEGISKHLEKVREDELKDL